MPDSHVKPKAIDRGELLVSTRNLKMARSSHAYVRGNTARFYDWLNSAEAINIPAGPPVWICGDCHVGNLGPIASAKGNIDVQIRDLDQTVIGNPAHDLIRLGLSMASAARGSDLPGVMTSRILEQLVLGYEAAFTDDIDENRVARPEAVERTLKDALKRNWKQLARERIKDTKPKIPLGRRFLKIDKSERAAIDTLFQQEEFRRLVTSLKSRDDDAQIEVLDAAYWVKGCSSLGLLRFAVLIGVGGAKGELCLVDIKEAVRAVAPAAPEIDMPKDNGERVVTGAWHLSPALGERMQWGQLLGKSVFVRELMPQDLKFEIEHLTADEALTVAYYLATVVGKAHARQMTEAERIAWRKQLARNRTKTLDAPTWLWTSVVDLLVHHEKAYLEHCRKYASPAA